MGNDCFIANKPLRTSLARVNVYININVYKYVRYINSFNLNSKLIVLIKMIFFSPVKYKCHFITAPPFQNTEMRYQKYWSFIYIRLEIFIIQMTYLIILSSSPLDVLRTCCCNAYDLRPSVSAIQFNTSMLSPGSVQSPIPSTVYVFIPLGCAYDHLQCFLVRFSFKTLSNDFCRALN